MARQRSLLTGQALACWAVRATKPGFWVSLSHSEHGLTRCGSDLSLLHADANLQAWLAPRAAAQHVFDTVCVVARGS